MGLRELGSFLLAIGGLLVLVGLGLVLFPRGLGWLGHLPGDLQFKLGEHGRLYIPLGTSLLISLVLSLALSLGLYLLRLLGR